jgi:hypothetical protein
LAVICHNKVWFPVAIQVTNRNRNDRVATGIIVNRSLECTVAVSQQHIHSATARPTAATAKAIISHDQVSIAVAI